MGYCSASDVSIRLGLDSGQRDRAASRISSVIRRATVVIDQMFRDYGRNAPSSSIASSTLNGAVVAGATTITLTSGTDFATSGTGNIDGDTFKWTGKSTHNLTGCTGIDFGHSSGVLVEAGEFAAVIREISADLAASIYLEDESAFHTAGADPVRSNILRTRSEAALVRLAHLGTVD
tara:strand:+ start:759 stop:1289 length:531 start_codon:yes stop_codon:yes gene_type:complete